jgi:hypothetical protein
VDDDTLGGDSEQLEAAPSSWSPSRVVATTTAAIVAVALVVIGAVVGHHKASPRHPNPPSPVPSAPVPSTQAAPPTKPFPYRGSVFLEPLQECLATDHQQTLRLAVEVTNLSSGKLRVLAATPVSSLPDVRLTAVTYWQRACGGVTKPSQLVLASGQHVVVALTLALGATCPADDLIGARITFEAGGERLRAESSTLADLAHVRFAQCGG